MSNIAIIIQRTYNGLSTEYSSMPKSQLASFSAVLIDERSDSAQIASGKVYYSVMNYEKVKVYSFINASVKDVSKRDGFYAVRLIVGAGYDIKNVESILNKIAQRYHSAIQNNNQASQDYRDILAEATLQPNNIIKSANVSSSEKYYYLKDPNQSVSDLLNSKAGKYVNLLYVFNNEDGMSNAISHFSFKPVEQLESQLNIIAIDNSSRYLSKMIINNQEIRTQGDKFNLLVHQNDEIISVNKENKKIVHSPNNSNIKIAGPQLKDLPESRSKNQKDMEDFSPRSFMLGAGLVLLLAALSFGGLYFLKYKPLQKVIKEKTNEISNFDDVKKELENYKKGDALGIIKDKQGNKYAIVSDYMLKGNVNDKYEYIQLHKFNAIDENTIKRVSNDEKIKDIQGEFGFALNKSSSDSQNDSSNNTSDVEQPEDQPQLEKPVNNAEVEVKNSDNQVDAPKNQEAPKPAPNSQPKSNESKPSKDVTPNIDPTQTS